METCVATVDIGTTGAKGTIFSLDGKPLAAAYREYPCVYPKPGWVEQDADLLVRSALETLFISVRESGKPAEAIRSVSVSAQRCCGIFLDENGKQLRPMISWQDNRTAVEVEEITELISPDEYYKRTGYPNSTTWLLSKMMWVRKNEPDIWKRTRRVVQMHDYFLNSLGVDDFIVDSNDAGFFGFFDSAGNTWDSGLTDLFGIDQSILPVPVSSGTEVGRVTAEGAARSGLLQGTIIAVGAGDQAAGSLGAGVVRPGTVSVSMGTAGAVNAFLDTPFRDPHGSGMVTSHTRQGHWLLEAHQAAAAGVYRWFRDEIATKEHSEADAASIDYYAYMDEKVANIPVGSRGLLMLPYFAGAATPRYNPDARGVLLGLTFAHDRLCMARAFMEGITLDMKDMLESFTRSGINVSDVRILGGPTKSGLWNQIQSDVYGTPVSTLEVGDATLLGAAILAAVGAGLYSDIVEAADNMVRVKHVYEPIKENVQTYSGLYDAFCRAYEGLAENKVFESLAGFQSGD